jgi:hypothetical protein
MSYAFKNEIQGLSNGTFIGRFKNDSGYGESNEETTIKFSLVGTDKLRWDGFDGLLVKCATTAGETL